MDQARFRTVREEYGFACTQCGNAWQRTYDIEHHRDAAGRPFLVYRVAGRRVRSPFSRLVCDRCGSTTVRVLRPDRVAAARASYRP